jgi:hypothetical protein
MAVETLDERSRQMIRSEEPARATGYFLAIDELKEAIVAEAESEQSRRKAQLAELTFPEEKGSN